MRFARPVLIIRCIAIKVHSQQRTEAGKDKCLATRSTNKNWFLDLFALFLGLATVLRFDASMIEEAFFKKEGM